MVLLLQAKDVSDHYPIEMQIYGKGTLGIMYDRDGHNNLAYILNLIYKLVRSSHARSKTFLNGMYYLSYKM